MHTSARVPAHIFVVIRSYADSAEDVAPKYRGDSSCHTRRTQVNWRFDMGPYGADINTRKVTCISSVRCRKYHIHLITTCRGLSTYAQKRKTVTANFSGADKTWPFVVVLTVSRAAVDREQYQSLTIPETVLQISQPGKRAYQQLMS